MIERHGGLRLGSSRADLHSWVLNVDQKTAEVTQAGTKQVRPRQPNMDVHPIAQAIVHLILGHHKDERLQWFPDGHVRILIEKILPELSASQQTLKERRKRFRKAIEAPLREAGWEPRGLYVYPPPRSEP